MDIEKSASDCENNIGLAGGITGGFYDDFYGYFGNHI